MKQELPTISVLIPVHNEEEILSEQVLKIVEEMRKLENRFELLLIENGSTDRTGDICNRLTRQLPELEVVQIPVGDYGLALKQGIFEAKNDLVVIFNVEFWNIEFVEIALTALRSRTLVIGSKSAPGAHDDRPFLRRSITKTYNQVLRLLWRFDGTDTHGMKAFWRDALLPVAASCKTGSWVFDTEFVLRAQRSNLPKLELPTDARELRAPSYASLARRVPSVLKNLWLLWRNISPTPFHTSSPAESKLEREIV